MNAVARRLWSPQNRWKVLLAAWMLVAVLYCWGIAGISPPGEDWSWWDRLYALPDVYSFGLGNDIAALDGRVQAARFLGPGVAAASFFQASAVLFKEQLDAWRLSRLRDHVIVCGAGEMGGRIALDFARQGRGTVVVDHDPASPGAATAKAAGAFVVFGDAGDPDVLRRAGVGRARDLVAITGSDGRNVEITTVARHLHEPAHSTLRCSVHLLDGELCNLLRLEELRGQQRAVSTDYMNVFQRGARFWLHDADPLVPASGVPHIVIIGSDDLCLELLVAVLQAAGATEGPEPLVTLVASDASDQLGALRLHHPLLLGSARVDGLDLDPSRPGASAAPHFGDLLRDGSVTSVFVGVAEETDALRIALLAQRLLTPRAVPVHVRTAADGGLALLLGRHQQAGGPSLHGFGFYDRTCTAAAIDGGTAEALAQSIHADYQTAARRDGTTGPLTADWEDLPESGRDSNRAAAAHIVERLAAVGCAVVPMFRWDDSSFALADDQIETLARLEHERWMAERRAAGWQHGDTRDNQRKLNPMLVPWAELDGAGRSANLDSARALPGLLARAGFEIVAS